MRLVWLWYPSPPTPGADQNRGRRPWAAADVLYEAVAVRHVVDLQLGVLPGVYDCARRVAAVIASHDGGSLAGLAGLGRRCGLAQPGFGRSHVASRVVSAPDGAPRITCSTAEVCAL